MVSVIIPVYNAEKFLAETIESVLQQDFSGFEIIIVNDGSSDNSAAICTELVNRDSRVKYLPQDNSGVSVARNNGLKHATGEYIFFLDADDTLDSKFLKTSYETAKENDSDIVIIGAYFARRMPNVMALPTWAQFIKHEFLKNHPEIRFPTGIQPGEDGIFSHQLLALTKKVSFNPKGIYNYRKHDQQNHVTINNNAEKVLADIPKWLQILEEFYAENDLFHSHALHLALFMEHEPFEFRYLGMPLNDEQKKILHTIIKDFMVKNVTTFLRKTDRRHLSKPFRYFLKTDDVKIFDSFYAEYLRKRQLRLSLIDQIPVKSIQRKLRRKFEG